MLLGRGAQVNAQEKNSGLTPLMAGIASGLPQHQIKALLARGAQVNARDVLGNTALIRASAFRGSSVLKMLLAYGADPTVKNRRGQTALHRAIRARNTTNSALLRQAVTKWQSG